MTANLGRGQGKLWSARSSTDFYWWRTATLLDFPYVSLQQLFCIWRRRKMEKWNHINKDMWFFWDVSLQISKFNGFFKFFFWENWRTRLGLNTGPVTTLDTYTDSIWAGSRKTHTGGQFTTWLDGTPITFFDWAYTDPFPRQRGLPNGEF